MDRPSKIFIATISSLVFLCASAVNADFDIDDSDSLDFESFHTDKKSAIKVYENKKTTTKKVYKEAVTNSTDHSQNNNSTKAVIEDAEDGYTGIYEIRERYTLNKSIHTPYSAFYVIENLHKQMAKLCPQGWEKQREWSVAADDDFYMHYQFQCLPK